MKKCSIIDCDRVFLAKKMCKLHYTRERAKDPSYRKRNAEYERKWYRTDQGYLAVQKHKLTPKRRFSSYLSVIRIKKYVNELTLEKFAEITSYPCVYCGEFSKSYCHTGIDRIDSKQGYILDNIVSCCDICNKMKLNLSIDEFLSHMRKVLNYYESNLTQCIIR